MARYGILITPSTSTKAKQFLQALHESGRELGIKCFISHAYQPCDVLILYGLGGNDRLDVASSHLKSGKPFIAWDLPYWNRNGRTFRMSVNGNHPKTVMDGPYNGPSRFNAARLTIGRVSNPDGPIMVVGHGPKSNAVGADGWAKRKVKEIYKAFPDREVLYRPKPRRPVESGCELLPQSTLPIEEALQGISFVVCRHSNVAVDACRMGAPVVCDDGAAAAIYPQELSDKDNQPSEAIRLEFLHRLAWWQYSKDEVDLAWKWMASRLTSDAVIGSKTAISI